jgi:hypothetical protein
MQVACKQVHSQKVSTREYTKKNDIYVRSNGRFGTAGTYTLRITGEKMLAFNTRGTKLCFDRGAAKNSQFSKSIRCTLLQILYILCVKQTSNF